MLEFPRWKYVLVAAVMLLALLFALPNFFGTDPALQVARKNRLPMDAFAQKEVEQSLGAHSAPLGLSFVTAGLPTGLPAPYTAGALVGVHGSWNRTPPRAPEVSFLPWQNGTLGDQRTLVGGFQDATGDRWGRPVAAVLGPDGAVYISDDTAGAIYRLAPPGR